VNVLVGKRQTIIIASLILVLALFFVFTPNNSQKRPDGFIKLEVEAVPSDAKILIDQYEHKSPVSIYLRPGIYTISYERYGFKSFSHKIDLLEDSKDLVALEPITEEAQKWKDNNLFEYARVDGFIQTKAELAGIKYSDKYPLLLKLPVITSAFQIGANDTTILIHALPTNQYLAVDALKSYKIDLSPYNYMFINDDNPNQETNPFKQSHPNL